jgi:hypothetical protein
MVETEDLAKASPSALFLSIEILEKLLLLTDILILPLTGMVGMVIELPVMYYSIQYRLEGRAWQTLSLQRLRSLAVN